LPEEEMKVTRITVVGCGLIGASFALASRRCLPDVRIAGWDSSSMALNLALERGIIDELDEAIAGEKVSTSDLIYLAMPVGGIKSFLQDRGAQVARGAIVTDAGSIKSGVCETALNYLPEGRLFVGGHPVAGSHLAGLEHARANFFDNAPYVLINEQRRTNDEALATMKELVEMLGARVVLTTAAEHDRAMALVSHLPQLISSVLAATIDRQATADMLKRIAGTGYRDMTRLAESSWSMWGDIFATNAGPIANAVDEMLEQLVAVRDELRRGAAQTNPKLVKTGALFYQAH
jgi:prephenate dehydrogenase